MLSNVYETSPRLRSGPMSAPQPPGAPPGPGPVGLGLGMSAPTVNVGVIGPQVTAPSVVAGPMPGGVLKNGAALHGPEEEVSCVCVCWDGGLVLPSGMACV